MKFTPREIEVLQLLSNGLVDKEIAAVLKVSTHTVDFHVRRIFSKMRVHSRVVAAVRHSNTLRSPVATSTRSVRHRSPRVNVSK